MYPKAQKTEFFNLMTFLKNYLSNSNVNISTKHLYKSIARGRQVLASLQKLWVTFLSSVSYDFRSDHFITQAILTSCLFNELV